ncbi:MAG: methylated-DNA--[protein]-cysteine S-methyltransferase [Calditrichaeota bacterium]|nr:MAG: methylated-DNA--[protein]-cysteine S-methyltransferase [Calditrichota bacterium]MBL1204072.1 methylated-DNA--[protein]-cysteine S-methyltransferase [Calditrichota bacterium]NOG43903.1 methylated-DNA--[protein]-cysteine S-methyltransferase [Calditrichota bacterium]
MNVSLSFQEKYDAIGNKESLYEGLFITAVKTTGIFCRPSCRAKKPKAENVVFYDTSQQAIQNGYRPCKICKPMALEGESPDFIKEIMSELQENPNLKIKDSDLQKRGISPSRLRRWFKEHHNMTFQSYQRMLRLSKAFNQIKNGESVTETAFESGYQSLSGFNEEFKNIFEKSPSNSKDKKVINIVRFSTKLGMMFACATEDKLYLLEFSDRKMLEQEFQDLSKTMDAVILPGSNKILDQVQTELEEYFDGNRKEFTVPLCTPGTPFQQTVWEVLQEIPYGETWSYQNQSNKLNKPKAVRAVAAANGQNRIAIIIPCHRVIGSNGQLTGYAAGLAKKKWLLEHEKQHSGKPIQKELLL